MNASGHQRFLPTGLYPIITSSSSPSPHECSSSWQELQERQEDPLWYVCSSAVINTALLRLRAGPEERVDGTSLSLSASRSSLSGENLLG
ncbi:hypothetical protein NHX12_033828 [Muraenolepis orangiensis]|uniref:Uncharacterized protein n=1 Tax=Muraenolepis orangiensis TaxID=630683 RepID=A0A9Q0IIB4_9TELE|nr:hypothetical protein NHX12_033828 [Muraenolepis orangiensis]